MAYFTYSGGEIYIDCYNISLNAALSVESLFRCSGSSDSEADLISIRGLFPCHDFT